MVTERVFLVAANHREAQHYRSVMAETDPRFRGRVTVVTPVTGHHALRGLRSDAAIFVMDCTWRRDAWTRHHNELARELAHLGVLGAQITRVPCPRPRKGEQ